MGLREKLNDDGTTSREVSRSNRGKFQIYEVLHGNPAIHRGTEDPNRLIAIARGRRHKMMGLDGFPLSKKGRRQSRQPGGQGKYS